MKKATREKIAVVVFILLLILAAVVLIAYFATGRSWTQAASVVDDATGSMEGYSVIVYSGTVEPQIVSAPRSDDNTELESQKSTTELSLDRSSRDEDLSTSTDDSIGLGILSLLPRIVTNENDDEGVFVSDVRDLYERKDAEVLSLDIQDMSDYYEPQIFYVGDKKIGVFSVDYYATQSWLARFNEYFKENDVDIVVCITMRTNLLATYEGMDVVIVTTDSEKISTTGRTEGTTLVVRSPEQGEVGVVVLSSNDVPSARVISTL